LRRAVLVGREGSASVATAAAEMQQLGVSAPRLCADARDPRTVAGVVDAAFAHLGDVDLVLIAWGVRTGEPAELIAVNYTSSALAALAAARHIEAQGHGVIAVFSGIGGGWLYDWTEEAKGRFFEGLGVNVMVVRSGMLAAPAIVAGAVVRGLARRAKVVWVPPTLRIATAMRRVVTPGRAR